MSKMLKLNLSSHEPLLSPAELRARIPMGANRAQFVEQSRQVVTDIISGRDPRKLLIVGPCSVHDTTGAKEYASRLKDLATECNETFFIVMRAFFEKPRTTVGWKGLIYDPHLDGSNAIGTGLEHARRFLIDLADMGVPAATEFVDPATPYYIGDLITWGAVGARTAASQIHRQMASTLPIPIGFKNSTDGNLETAVQAVVAAASPHSFIGMDDFGQAAIIRSNGNRLCHVVLRGAEDHPNFDRATILDTVQRLQEWEVIPRIIVDCAHDNAGKDHRRQPIVFRSLINQIRQGCGHIAGTMLESYLKAGNQPWRGDANSLQVDLSITDPCIDIEQTEELIRWAQEALQGTSEPVIRQEPDHETLYAPQFAQ